MPINAKEPLVIGKEPVHYTSMYGYPKDRIPVFLQSDTEQTSPIGYIKEEIVRDKAGEETGRVYYTRASWRDHGQPRFFDSPEALIVAFGGAIARKVGLKKPRGKVAAKSTTRAAKKAPRKTKTA